MALIALLLILSLGVWAHLTVERSQKPPRRDELHALLRASVDGVTAWLGIQRAVASAAASDAVVIEGVRALEGAEGDTGRNAQESLRQRLSLLMNGAHYDQFFIVRPNGSVAATNAKQDVVLPAGAALEEDPKAENAGASRIWPPYMTGTGKARMAVSAPIKDEGRRIATLFLMFDPELEFSSILSAARSGNTGETYAFNKSGRLVSKSRFDESLRSLGLIGIDVSSASLNLEIRDPGADLTRGEEGDPSTERPFTLPVKSALEGNGSGVDIDGYRDYRGVPVIGAWTWLADYQIGIVTEKDASEAFASRDTIRRTLGYVFLALVGVVLVLLLVTYFASLLRGRAKRAETRIQELGHYRLTRKLGEGGMGAVYEGQHTMLQRPTAIKLLRPDASADPHAAARFEREVRMTSLLTHPNTIAVYDYGVTAEGTLYYAMEFLQGVDLDELVARIGPLPAGRAIHLLLQACGSLGEAHEVGLIHRDVKPANLIVCTRGGIRDMLKVLDFGLVKQPGKSDAKLTQVNTIIGTPAFLAPEVVIDAEQASPASDLYSLGATAYYLLTGHTVFENGETLQVLTAQMTEAPKPLRAHVPGVPLDIEEVVLRCLEKDPVARYSSMDALAQALKACVSYGSWTEEQARTFWDTHPGLSPRQASLTVDDRGIDIDDVTRGAA